MCGRGTERRKRGRKGEGEKHKIRQGSVPFEEESCCFGRVNPGETARLCVIKGLEFALGGAEILRRATRNGESTATSSGT